jgi:hypothetical protein
MANPKRSVHGIWRRWWDKVATRRRTNSRRLDSLVQEPSSCELDLRDVQPVCIFPAADDQ